MNSIRRLFLKLSAFRGGGRNQKKIRWGSLRSTTPVSRVFGFDRGTPIDRYYIENFLSSQQSLIRGTVLEVGDATYTKRFGGERVLESNVLHAIAGIPHATLVGDLVTGQGIPEETFDCMILTQVLPFLSDCHLAVQTIHRSLRNEGVALLTVPGISQVSRYDMDRWGDYWRFTDHSARMLFEAEFGAENVVVSIFGNVLAATAFLQGVSVEEMTKAELDVLDPDYQVTICIVAVKRPVISNAPGTLVGI